MPWHYLTLDLYWLALPQSGIDGFGTFLRMLLSPDLLSRSRRKCHASLRKTAYYDKISQYSLPLSHKEVKSDQKREVLINRLVIDIKTASQALKDNVDLI